MTAKKRFVFISFPIVVFILIFILQIIAILRMNDNHLVYTLDDAYIHLSLAENIARGEYGINLGEPSAPSSSIVWPFLLYPFSKSAMSYLVPLVLNFLAAVGSIIILVRILFLIFDCAQSIKMTYFTLFTAILLIPSTNLTGVVFTGMENSLQIFLSLLLLLGIISLLRDSKTPWWFYPVLIIGPLVRYENLALSVPTLIFLRGSRIKATIISSVLMLIPLIGFSLFLDSRNLGIFPSSVLVKSSPVLRMGSPIAILGNFLRNIVLYRQGFVLLLILVWFVYADFKLNKQKKDYILIRIVAVAAFLHLLFGQFDPNNRYEIYIWSTMLLTLLYQNRASIMGFVERKPLYQTILIACLFMGLSGFPYIKSIADIPLASNNIYCQHYQMRRFITEFYPVNIAVNDIGFVSYRNDNYVLDLWGLTSRKALFHRLNRDNPEWINNLSKEHNVKLAMIYDQWFPVIPNDWKPVAELAITRRRISPAFSDVTFYAIGNESSYQVKFLLMQFKKSLPSGIRFTIIE